MSSQRKRLELKRETVRYLGDSELAAVYGGGTSGASTNVKSALICGSFQTALNKGPDDEDVRPPPRPPTLPPAGPTPRPVPLPPPVITGASYYCG